MLEEKQTFRYFLFSFSNFIAAFGGGMILGKSVDIINTPYLHGGSILAFFIGTVIGLGLLQFIPDTISKPLARWFSICGGITSLVLVSILANYAISGKLTGFIAYFFFFLLSVRFAFWFYSRVLRASNAAGHQQKIAWVELGYYSGMILGLIIWKFPGAEIGLATALIIDAIVQIVAGTIDIFANFIPVFESLVKTSDTEIANNIPTIANKEFWKWRLALAVVLLTISVQVIVFNLAHHASDTFSSFILATFYFGVSIAALVCKKYKIHLEWNYPPKKALGYAMICVEFNANKSAIHFLSIGIGAAICVVGAVLFTNFNSLANIVDGYLKSLKNSEHLIHI